MVLNAAPVRRTYELDRGCPNCSTGMADQEPTARCSRCDTLVAEGCIVVSVCNGRHPYACGNNPDCNGGDEIGCCRCRPGIEEGDR